VRQTNLATAYQTVKKESYFGFLSCKKINQNEKNIIQIVLKGNFARYCVKLMVFHLNVIL
jgi:hypothetical protein